MHSRLSVEILNFPNKVRGSFQSESLSSETPERKIKHLQVYSQQEASVPLLKLRRLNLLLGKINKEEPHLRQKEQPIFSEAPQFQSKLPSHPHLCAEESSTTPLKTPDVTRGSWFINMPKISFCKVAIKWCKKKRKKKGTKSLSRLHDQSCLLCESSWKGRKQGYVRASPHF